MQKEEEEYIQCPYEVSHRILKKRFQVHLGRCRKNHLNTEKVICPFNVTHVLNKPELNWHVSQCPERSSFENFRHVDEAVNTTVAAGSSETKIELHPGFTSSWDQDDVPTYNPRAYAQNAQVLRSIQGAPPSKKKEFRQNERMRLLGISNQKKE